MKAARILTFAGILSGAIALGVGYAGDAATASWYLVIAATALLWAAGEWRGRGMLASGAFIISVGLAATGVLLDRSTVWMVIAVVAGLSAWGLGHFTRQVEHATRIEDREGLVRRYIVRLLVLDGGSLALAAIALRVRIHLAFVPALLLGAALVFSLSYAVAILRRTT